MLYALVRARLDTHAAPGGLPGTQVHTYKGAYLCTLCEVRHLAGKACLTGCPLS